MTIRDLFTIITERTYITIINDRSNRVIFKGQADCLPIKYLSLGVYKILPVNNRLEVIIL